MTKSDLITKVAEDHGMTKGQAKSVVETVLNTIKECTTIAKQDVTLSSFGKFSVTERAARMGRNPKTGDPVQIAAKSVVKFKAYN